MLRRILDSPWTYFVLAGLLLVAAVLSQFEIRGPARPPGTPEDLGRLGEREDVSVVFVLIDTLRADRLGSYGYERDTSPWIDELARTGVRFERVVSQSTWTKSSMASLWTGLYPARNGVLRWGHALPEEAPMVAEIFAASGFRTAGVWRNGWVGPNFGFAQGFDSYVQPLGGMGFRGPGRLQRRVRAYERLKGSDEDVTRTALEFLRTYADRRFLLYVHYMDVHQYTYDDRAAIFGTSYSDAYDNAIRWTDRNVGALVSELDRLGLRDRTLIVVGSDHGEEFFEHGSEGHARNLYRETTEVPVVLGLPFRLEQGIVVRSLVQNVDLWPTLLDLLGLPALPGADGRSLVPLIEAAARGSEPETSAGTEGARRAFAQLDRRWGRPREASRPMVAVTEGSYRLILRLDPGDTTDVELFDHAADPGETQDLAESHPEAVERLRDVAMAYLDGSEAAWGGPVEVEISELEANQLRALGYVVR